VIPKAKRTEKKKAHMEGKRAARLLRTGLPVLSLVTAR
jgi:hypothetical protein